MLLSTALDFSLPFKNPVIIFSLVLFIILFTPILLNRVKIPHIIGLIIAGIAIGPYGFNLLLRDSSIVLFGTVGLLYIMFLAGLEIDMVEFNKNKFRSIIFGLLTFTFPIALGFFVSYYILAMPLLSAILLASMLCSHTLLAYPVVSRYGLVNNKAVTITIGGTLITDVLALLILAVVVGMTQGEVDSAFWIQISISIVVFVAIILLLFPFIARWFFKSVDDSVSQYIFVLAMVFLGGFMAELAGVEAIIGAFLSGLALNKFIPHNSALMNRIGFVGNALFIPFFLVGVGMLVDVRVFFGSLESLKVGALITGVVIIGKFAAAWIAQKIFKMKREEGMIMFGLSVAQAAATLAVVLVGYNIILGESPTGEPIRMLNEAILNGSIMSILVCCTVSSLVVEKNSKRLADQEGVVQNEGEEKDSSTRILISLDEPETVNDLLDLSVMMKPAKGKSDLVALNVVEEKNDGEGSRKASEKMMKTAEETAAGFDIALKPVIRYDQNVAKGILYTIRENNITDIILGVTQEGSAKHKIGLTTQQILESTNETVYVHLSVQPFNTLKRIIVAVHARAMLEEGFVFWLERLITISKNSGLPITFYTDKRSQMELTRLNELRPKPVALKFEDFDDFDDFLILTSVLQKDDLFVVVSSRKGYTSYVRQLDKVKMQLSRYFRKNSYILIYPKQTLSYSKLEDIHHEEGTILDVFSEGKKAVDKAGRIFSGLWKKKEE